MNIKISERIAPYSFSNHTLLPIPNSRSTLEVRPNRIIFLIEDRVESIDLQRTGPIKQFMTQLDVERERVVIQGSSLEGFFRVFIEQKDDFIEVAFKNLPLERREIKSSRTKSIIDKEKLFLGVTKSQDIDLIWRRKNCSEIFPIWFYLAQNFFHKNNEIVGEVDEIERHCYLHFKSLFIPQNCSDLHLGYKTSWLENRGAMDIFSIGYSAIRSLFFRAEKDRFFFLEKAFPQFDRGKLLNIKTGPIVINIEWSKKKMRKMEVYSLEAQKIIINVGSRVNSCRVRVGKKQRGVSHKLSDQLIINANQNYVLDRFEK